MTLRPSTGNTQGIRLSKVPPTNAPINADRKVVFGPSELVRQAFGQRRKTLRNALRTLLDEDEISAAGIDPGMRAETLGLAEFAALANQVADR